MAVGGAPPGWYTDPAGGGGQRWWDGSTWTAHAVPRPPLDDEATPARWARNALLAVIPAQTAANALLRHGVRNLIEHPPDLYDASTGSPWLGHGLAVAMQALGAVTTVAGVIFLIWFARSAHNARLLGLPARRTPAAAVAGFIVPIINLWWPYQSSCDLMPDDAATRRIVLRWFLLWIVGGFAGGIITVVSAFVSSWVGWTLLLVPAALTTLAALAARQVVAMVVQTHEALARA